MQFKADTDKVVRLLEIIMVTQQTEEGADATANSVAQQASDMLLTIVRSPLKCSTVILSEREMEFLRDYI